MTDLNRQLVQQITEQVLTVLQQRRAAAGGDGRSTQPGGAQPTGTERAAIRPPAGVCTGDYSKFTELAGQSVGAGRSTLRQGDAATGHGGPMAGTLPREASALALYGIVTAQQLQEAIAASPNGVAVLAHDARPTPLANDFLRQHPEKVRRLTRPAQPTRSAGGGSNPAASGAESLPWLWWADGHCPAVQALTNRLRSQLQASAAARSDSGLVQIVRDLAEGVAGGRVQGGVLFVRSAAMAACYANRCGALRAVVGTGEEAVDLAVRDLGANVLVVEYPRVRPTTMDAMVERILSQPPRSPAHVERHLAELQADLQAQRIGR